MRISPGQPLNRTQAREAAQQLVDEGFEFQAPSLLPWSEEWKPISPRSVARKLASKSSQIQVRDSRWSGSVPLRSEEDLRELVALSKQSTEGLARPDVGQALLELRRQGWDFRKASEPDGYLYACGSYGAYNAVTDPGWEGVEIVAVSPAGSSMALTSVEQVQELKAFLDTPEVLDEIARGLRALEKAGYHYHRGSGLITGYEAWKSPQDVWIGGRSHIVGADERWFRLSQVNPKDVDAARTRLKRFDDQLSQVGPIETARDTMEMLELPLKGTEFEEREAAWSAILELRAYGSWPGDARVCYAPQRPDGGFIQGARADFHVVSACRLPGESLLDATRRFGKLIQVFRPLDLNDSSPLEAFAWLSKLPSDQREGMQRELLATLEWTKDARERGLFGDKNQRECYREVLHDCLKAGNPVEVREALVRGVAHLAEIPLPEPSPPGVVKVYEDSVDVGGIRVPRRTQNIVPES